MRSLGGLVLLAGLGVGLFVYLPAPGDSSLSLDAAQRAAIRLNAIEIATTEHQAAQPPRVAQSATVRERTFAPNVSLASFKSATPGVTVIRPTSSGAQRDASGGWQAVVTSGSATQTSATTLTPTSPQSRYELIVQIQQQLKRLGCYYGRVDGSWGVGSKEAMRNFTERVNAALPVEEPDYLLLSLLEAQNGKTCSAECPPGLAATAEGRCIAKPAYAQTPSTGEVLPWKAATATANAETPTASPAPLFRPVATSVVSSEPLPGRMSIGGPKELPPVNTYNAPSAYNPAGAHEPVATAAAALEGASSAPPRVRASSSSSSERRVRTRRSARHDPIRRNLLLSLGGAY